MNSEKLLNAAREIHSGPSIFNHANAFPAAEAIDMPLSSAAIVAATRMEDAVIRN